MNCLAIDTSGDLIVTLICGTKKETRYLKGCETRHSLTLMPYVEEVMEALDLKLTDLDFIAVVTGPGSFTGIRIGVATVKALCFASDKPALSLISFDVLSYGAGAPEKCFCVINANHGNYYCAAYDNHKNTFCPCFLSRGEVLEKSAGYVITSGVGTDFEGAVTVDKQSGLFNAVMAKCGSLCALEDIVPLYVRRSQAEEELC